MTALAFASVAFVGLVAFVHFATMAFSEVGQPHDIAGMCFGAVTMVLAIFILPGAL